MKMFKRIKIAPQLLLMLMVLLTGTQYSADAQSIFKKLKDKVKIQVPGAEILSTVLPKSAGKSNYQNISISAIDTNKSYKIAEDLYMNIGDIKKTYPDGYGPQWAIIRNYAQMDFTKVNYLQNKLTNTATGSLAIGEINGKAYVFFAGFLSCNCAAQLLKENEHVLISSNAQSFFVNDFRKITPDGKITAEPCKLMTGSYYDTKGWNLKISLSIDNQQTLVVSPALTSLTVQQSYINRNGTDMSATWTATDVKLPNLVTPEKAISDKRYKEQAKKDAIARQTAMEKRARINEASFELQIKNSLKNVAKQQSQNPKFKAGCIKIESGSYYSPPEEDIVPFQTPYSWDEGRWLKNLVGNTYRTYQGLKNVCDTRIVINGITKSRSTQNTIYYEDSSIELSPGEMTNSIIDIEESYNPNTAKVGSTHYFKNKLIVK